MVKLCLIPVMKSVAFEATGTKPDLMPGASGVVRLGDETPMGTHGAANEDCVTVWFWSYVSQLDEVNGDTNVPLGRRQTRPMSQEQQQCCRGSSLSSRCCQRHGLLAQERSRVG